MHERPHRAQSSVSCTFLLAIRFESFVESDGSLGNIPVESKCDKEFLWHSLMDKFWNVIESELPVVLRMPYETTAASIHGPQSCQSLADQGPANALALVCRRDRNRSKSIPVRCAVGNGHGRERNVTSDPVIHLCDQRYREGIAGA